MNTVTDYGATTPGQAADPVPTAIEKADSKQASLVESITRVYKKLGTLQKVAEVVHRKPATIRDILEQAGVRVRQNNKPEWLPTPEEIEQRAAEIRKTWGTMKPRSEEGTWDEIPNHSIRDEKPVKVFPCDRELAS